MLNIKRQMPNNFFILSNINQQIFNYNIEYGFIVQNY